MHIGVFLIQSADTDVHESGCRILPTQPHMGGTKWFSCHVLHRAVIKTWSGCPTDIETLSLGDIFQLCKVRSFYIIDCTNGTNLFNTISLSGCGSFLSAHFTLVKDALIEIGYVVTSLVVGRWLVGRWLVVTRVHCGQTVHPRPIVTMEH